MIKRAYGVDDKMPCPQCAGQLSLIRRGPHPGMDSGYEAQIFGCSHCDYTEQRVADREGHAAEPEKRIG